MSGRLASVPTMTPHPWHRVRDMDDVRVIFVDLPDGVMGFCDHDKRTIWITNGLKQRERRAVLEHELTHLDRGRVCGHFETEEERAVEIATARTLIPLAPLLDALKWSRDMHEVASEIWVPVDLLVVRWAHLHPSERPHIQAALAAVAELHAP